MARRRGISTTINSSRRESIAPTGRIRSQTSSLRDKSLRTNVSPLITVGEGRSENDHPIFSRLGETADSRKWQDTGSNLVDSEEGIIRHAWTEPVFHIFFISGHHRRILLHSFIPTPFAYDKGLFHNARLYINVLNCSQQYTDLHEIMITCATGEAGGLLGLLLSDVRALPGMSPSLESPT
jgi:hypothetical protein